MRAKLSISTNSEYIIAEVDNVAIFKNSYLKIVIKSLGGSIEGPRLSIPVTQAEKLVQQYKDIKDAFDEAGCDVDVDFSASSTINDIEQSEEIFINSCIRARSVWDGDIEPEDFQDFSRTIQQKFQTRVLSDRQMLSSYHLASTSAACNFSVPGAGKTTIVLAAYAYLNSLPKDHPRHVNCLFVVGPMACFSPWETDYAHCFSESPKSVRFLSSISLEQKRRIVNGVDVENRHNDLYLSHFQTFAIYEKLFSQLFLRSDRKVMFVIDEAHNIKGADGVWSSAVLRVAPLAKARVILTGTPAPNGYEDLKNLFDFIHPNRNVLGFSRTALRLMSENKISANQLNAKSKIFFTRVRKKDLKIPPPIFNEVVIDMSPLQEKIYKQIESKFVQSFGEQKKTSRSRLFQAANLIRLRQAASNPMQLTEPISRALLEADVSDSDYNELVERANFVSEYLTQFKYENDLPKLDYLIKLAIAAQKAGEKVLIWTYFVKNIDLIYNYLNKNLDSPIYKITGATPVDQEATSQGEQEELTREKILDLFRNGIGSSILIATPQCLGESISLHHCCHKAVYFDRDFNCGLFIQSKDRIHRFGLKEDTVTEYFYLVSKNSVDEVISERLNEKEERMNDLLDSEDIPLLTEGFMQEQAKDIQCILDSYAKRGLL